MIKLFRNKTSNRIDRIIGILEEIRTSIGEIDKRLAGRERHRTGKHDGEFRRSDKVNLRDRYSRQSATERQTRNESSQEEI